MILFFSTLKEHFEKNVASFTACEFKILQLCNIFFLSRTGFG